MDVEQELYVKSVQGNEKKRKLRKFIEIISWFLIQRIAYWNKGFYASVLLPERGVVLSALKQTCLALVVTGLFLKIVTKGQR